MGGTSGPSGVAGSVELEVSAVAEAEDLVKVERTPRKVTLCSTARLISVKSCSLMPVNMVSKVTAFSARMSVRATGMLCFEQSYSSQGELSPA